MPRRRDIVNALRVTALWLLVVSVLAGPLGVGASVASAAVKTCGVSCPCDEAQHAEHADETAQADDDYDGSEGAHGDMAPCEDECPDDCPDCTCCPGLMVCLVPMVVSDFLGSASSSKLLTPPDALACGDVSGVFRPPRSLT